MRQIPLIFITVLLFHTANSLLHIEIDSGSGNFKVNVGGEVWLHGVPPTSSWGESGPEALKLLRSNFSTGTHPTLGSYNETRLFWSADDSVLVETAFKLFADGSTALLEQHFPDGVPHGGNQTPAKLPGISRPLLAFPDFSTGGRENELGAVAWSGIFAQMWNPVKMNKMPGAGIGRANGGPVVVFDETAQYRSLVVSPFDNFLASTSFTGDSDSWFWAHGISSEVRHLPSQFTHSTILSAGEGLTDGLQSWGAKMKKAHQTKRNSDIALSHLSYWTDNGAYYYMYGGHKANAECDKMAHGRMDKVLLQLVHSWQEQKLPVRSIQLDDWWYIGSDPASHDHMCIKELSPDPELFPSGLPSLPPQISYNLYGPFYCQDNIYRNNFSFTNSSAGADPTKDADPTPDASADFYTSLFHTTQKGTPMSNYEVDFLYDQVTWMAPFRESVDGAQRWLGGMAKAAAASNISVQYCMAHPAAFMTALSLPAVTNGRASGDYASPTGNLLDYGTAAMFFSAAGVAPSKDNWWSTPNQPGPRTLPTGPPPCDGGNRNVTDNYLHALVATLSTGPVGFSDAIGFNNASLIRATCDSAGRLLKPSLPLAAIDRSFATDEVTKGLAPGGHVWATHTAAGNMVWYMVLAITVHSDFTLLRSDLWPPLAASQDVVVWDSTDMAGSARLVQASTASLANLTTVAGSDHLNPLDFQYKLVAPVMPSSRGWAMLGEPDKLTPVSEQRQWGFDFAEGFLLRMVGAVGETVTVAAWKDGNVHTQTTVIGDNGEGAIGFG